MFFTLQHKERQNGNSDARQCRRPPSAQLRSLALLPERASAAANARWLGIK